MPLNEFCEQITSKQFGTTYWLICLLITYCIRSTVDMCRFLYCHCTLRCAVFDNIRGKDSGVLYSHYHGPYFYLPSDHWVQEIQSHHWLMPDGYLTWFCVPMPSDFRLTACIQILNWHDIPTDNSLVVRLMGVSMNTQEAYELASRGLIRPPYDSEAKQPVVYGIKTVGWEPPNLTLGKLIHDFPHKYIHIVSN